MLFSIIRVITAFVAFFIGVIFVMIFTSNRQADDVSDLQVLEIQSVLPNFANPPEQADSIKPEFTFDYDPTEFKPRGFYSAIGKLPKDLREFEGFELAAFESDKVKSGDKALGRIMIETRSNGMVNNYYTMSGSVTKKQLNFIAAPMFEEDYEFRFDGHFLKSGRLSKASKNQAVVIGKLIKLKNGVKIAESEVKFRVEYLGC